MPQENEVAAIVVAENTEAYPERYVMPPPAAVVEQATAEANALKQVIEDQRLYAVTGRDRNGVEKRHVMVEGWQTLGAMRGVFAITEWTRRTPDYVPLIVRSEWYTDDRGKRRKRVEVEQAGVGGWEARVQLVNSSGVVVGAAEAECTWEEEGWDKRPSNALRSMAQTRAIGKAYRGVFAFVMALAGYEATPREEMPHDVPQPPDLHNLPDGYDGTTWAKQVAYYLAGGDAAAARDMLGAAVEEANLEEGWGDDQTAAEAVVAALHGLPS